MLTHEQITKLEKLCDAEGVHYYDVKMEMVDHMAQSIEEKMIANPYLQFSDALMKTAASLGVYGFRRIAEEKEKKELQAARKRMRKIFLEFLTLPKIIFSLTLAGLLSAPRLFFNVSVKGNIVFDIAVTCIVLIGISIYIFINFKAPKLGLLSLPSIKSTKWWWGSLLVVNFLNVFNLSKHEEWINTMWFVLLFSFITVLANLYAIVWAHMYRQMYDDARKKYPLAFSK